MSSRTSLALGFLLVSTSVSCTVLEDMNGYAGGEADDSAVGTDTGSPVDTSVPDTLVADTGSPMDTTVADTGTPLDTSVADTGSPSDTSVADTGSPSDTSVADTFVADTFVADTATGDAPPCGTAYASFGLSEIMVRAISGTGDKREWLELTNYSTTSLDVTGVTAKVFGYTMATGWTERATLTFPSGTTLAASEAIVIAIDKTTFLDNLVSGFSAKTFDFAKIGDILVNSSAFEVRLFGPSCTAPYETASVARSLWPVGQSFAYPPASTTCPSTGRLTATNTLSTAWKDTAKDAAYVYGNVTIDGGVQPLYGTPGKANVGVACP